ncbi:hypothetical protein FIBSPDRAFT_249975 [Athelia psychrophila]|uniref:Uncharacterized protein n=1 Tax=Athelia psychrophila TaxID=1759441 RepID=A0A165XWK5_9AGAM|nr:hypothetical protein FIBSPDRAFT_249975 [Fibularhizoctonia sp. CBS 109695]
MPIPECTPEPVSFWHEVVDGIQINLICIPSTTSYTYRNVLRSPHPHQRLHTHGSIFSRSMAMENILILLNARQTHRVRLGSTPQRRRTLHKRICLPGAYRYPVICVWSQGVCR